MTEPGTPAVSIRFSKQNKSVGVGEEMLEVLLW